jgi:hypothetical protein
MDKQTTMRVAMYYNNNDVRIEKLPIPKITENELLVKIIASGICGSDYKLLDDNITIIPGLLSERLFRNSPIRTFRAFYFAFPALAGL